jgi:type IV secretory pathway VirB3-like protein
MFIYPGNLKEKKTFLGLTVIDLAVTGTLTVVFTVSAAQNKSLIPLVIPIMYLLLNIRVLEDGTNILIQLLKGFSYLVTSQQTYLWGERKEK